MAPLKRAIVRCSRGNISGCANGVKNILAVMLGSVADCVCLFWTPREQDNYKNLRPPSKSACKSVCICRMIDARERCDCAPSGRSLACLKQCRTPSDALALALLYMSLSEASSGTKALSKCRCQIKAGVVSLAQAHAFRTS